MNKNVGNADRFFRMLAALGLITCAVMAPLPLMVRLGAFGVMGAYLLFTSATARCVGYSLMGRSTCSLEKRL